MIYEGWRGGRGAWILGVGVTCVGSGHNMCSFLISPGGWLTNRRDETTSLACAYTLEKDWRENLTHRW